MTKRTRSLVSKAKTQHIDETGGRGSGMNNGNSLDDFDKIKQMAQNATLNGSLDFIKDENMRQ